MLWQSEKDRLDDYMRQASILSNKDFRWRMKGPCFYCGVDTIRSGSNWNRPNKYTRDHVRAKSKTKRGERRVTVTSCFDCNQKKGSHHPFSFVRKFLPHRLHKINWRAINWHAPKSLEFKNGNVHHVGG